MDFGTSKTLIEVVKKGAFIGTYFRDVYSSVIGRRHKESGEEFYQLKMLVVKLLLRLL